MDHLRLEVVRKSYTKTPLVSNIEIQQIISITISEKVLPHRTPTYNISSLQERPILPVKNGIFEEQTSPLNEEKKHL